MLRVGLTGGIGSGKSEVSRRLAAHGALVVDADVIAREVVEPGTPGLAEIVDAFGPEVLQPDGSLDREALAQRVFADVGLRAKLNAIVHPRVGERMAALERAARADGNPVVVFDVPLIAENRLAAGFDVVVVVDVPPDAQRERLVRLRGMTMQQAEARIAAQASREERLAIADIVIDNSGPLAGLDRKVDSLWAELQRRAAELQPGARRR